MNKKQMRKTHHIIYCFNSAIRAYYQIPTKILPPFNTQKYAYFLIKKNHYQILIQ